MNHPPVSFGRLCPGLPTTLRRAAMLVAAAALSACATAPPPPPSTPAAVGEVRAGSGYLKGYLAPTDMPDSLQLVGEPPAAGSAAFALDEEVHRQMKALRSGPRGVLAAHDAELRFPAAAAAFSCTLGIAITQEATPHLTTLLRRSLADAGGSTYGAKNKYKRTRPFVHYKEGSCTPSGEARLAHDGSYPSGHSALGYAWGLVLAQVAPERATALVVRGQAFGDSRLVCGVHWYSDVMAGRAVGAAAVARLQADPVFNAQVVLARAEVAQQRAQGSKPLGDCAAEAAALAAK